MGARTFSSRSEAVQDFQKKYAASYPSTFSREPSARPSYIPQTILIDNRSYPVYYDWGHGGYGYWRGSSWIAYDVIRDAVMLTALMHQNNYYYGEGYGYGPGSYGGGGYGPPPPPYAPHGAGIGFAIGLFCVILLVFGAIIVLRLLI